MNKRLLAIAAAAVTAISALTLPINAQNPDSNMTYFSEITWDTNQDGKVNYDDLAAILGHIKGVSPLSGSALTRSDIYGNDGKTDTRDYNLLYNYIYNHSIESKVLAFPGAVGGGCLATGGRGGQVVHVTNLNDSGEGSFREAVSHSNRIVVFDVGGTIELKSAVVVKSNVTIAGQTAPGGGGITLKNYKLGLGGDNIICRFIASRPGDIGGENDAWGGAKGSNSIIDHCSIGWANDEQWGLYSNNVNYTVQYSVIGPANSFGSHKKGVHGYGIMMGKGNVTFDHNLIPHNVARNFKGNIPGENVCDFTNNVIYDWGFRTTAGPIGHTNYVGNTQKLGNSSFVNSDHKYLYIGVDCVNNNNDIQKLKEAAKPIKVYMTGNQFLTKYNQEFNDFTRNNWNGVTYHADSGKNMYNTRSYEPFEMIVDGVNVSSVQNVESSVTAYENVLKHAGCGISSEKRIAIDRESANDTRNGTGYISGTRAYSEATGDAKTAIDKYQIKCGVVYEYPPAVLKNDIVDTDRDGMPDEWELQRGLDPNDPNDSKGDYLGSGYTNIEYYINDLTVDAFPEGVVKPSPTLSELNR